MSHPCPNRCPARSRGFTLIEVIGAIVIFSLGVLMATRLSEVLSIQVERSALRSRVVLEGQARMDSLSALAYEDLSVATTLDTLTLNGIAHELVMDVSSAGADIYQIDVSLAALDSVGPAYSATSYVWERW